MKIQRLVYFFYITILLQSSLVTNAQQPLIYDPEVMQICSGFQFVEGPVWKDGIGILFSVIPANAIYQWDEASGVDIF
jgi:sugar lactone lactonase YvrE